MADDTTTSRSLLNAVASVRAGQEQMQKDVDKLRAGMAAVLTCFAYTVALGILVALYLRKVAQ